MDAYSRRLFVNDDFKMTLHLFSTKMLDLPFQWLYSQISDLRTWYTQRKHDARQPDLKLS